MWLSSILQLLILILSPFFYTGTGRITLRLFRLAAERCLRFEIADDEDPGASALLLLGLLVNLWFVFMLSCLGAGLLPALVISWLPASRAAYDAFIAMFRSKRGFSLNFVGWFAVVGGLGLSLFNAKSGITTPWANNYGDLTFHLGMITSFVFGGNIPPEYHIFPGVSLSYPFFVNFWSSSLWAAQPTFRALSIIFTYQWLLLWLVIYRVLDGDRFRLLPWAVLFGAGSFDYLFNALLALPNSSPDLNAGAHAILRSGYPWTPFLTTIWVTQRPALLGAAVLLASVFLFHRYLANREGNAQKLLLSGLLLGFAPLTHFHLFLVGFLYIAMLLAFDYLIPESGRRPVKESALFFLPCGIALLSLPWLIGKKHIAAVIFGWMPWPKPEADTTVFSSLLASLNMWLNNAPNWFLFVFLLFAFGRRIRPLVVLVLLFIAANFVKLAVWDWDQIKIFLGIYLVTLSFVVFEERSKWPLTLSLVLLLLPGMYETGKVLFNYRDQQVYTEEEIRQAEAIRNATEPGAVVLAKPAHNSLITLTGRRLYSGYGGTLGSHGLDYKERAERQKNLELATKCEKAESGRVCPQYLLWTSREKEFWKKNEPEPNERFVPLLGNYFYRIKDPA